MNIISIINQKGGVAKTTTAAALGEGIRRAYKKKVLFVDLDPQGNLSFTLQADPGADNAFTVLQSPETIKGAIRKGREDVITSSPQLAGADNVFTFTGKEYRLKEALEGVSGEYDYCIIDTPPALGILTVNALTAADAVIIPVQADIYSLQGLLQLNATIETIRKYTNPRITLSGVLLTRYNARAVLSRDLSEVLQETAQTLHTRVYRATIRECISVKEAAYMRSSIYDYASTSNGAKDYLDFVQEFMEQEIKR